jgi:hypothetical protein
MVPGFVGVTSPLSPNLCNVNYYYQFLPTRRILTIGLFSQYDIHKQNHSVNAEISLL